MNNIEHSECTRLLCFVLFQILKYTGTIEKDEWFRDRLLQQQVFFFIREHCDWHKFLGMHCPQEYISVL